MSDCRSESNGDLPTDQSSHRLKIPQNTFSAASRISRINVIKLPGCSTLPGLIYLCGGSAKHRYERKGIVITYERDSGHTPCHFANLIPPEQTGASSADLQMHIWRFPSPDFARRISDSVPRRSNLGSICANLNSKTIRHLTELLRSVNIPLTDYVDS